LKTKHLSTWSRLFLALSGLSLIAVLFTPIWRIDLAAPQYPEGLSMTIHANDIKGNVDIINGLNHYIGMKTLHKEDFPEFRILPGCIIFFVVLFLLAAVLNRKTWFYGAFFLFVAFGITAMSDFWRWEYNYGHNLDPHAAIIVPGMAYQPPLIGFKQLLNFGAYSIPSTGGWIFLGCGVLLLCALLIEWAGALKLKHRAIPISTIALLLLFLSSCTKEPVPLHQGKDTCAYCKMTIEDLRFGGEIVTRTGKCIPFDDVQCLLSFYKEMSTDNRKQAVCYLSDFSGRHNLNQANDCILLRSNSLKCPMNGHLAAFHNEASFDLVAKTYQGEKVLWKELL
jgi:copper chaperone NosL